MQPALEPVEPVPSSASSGSVSAPVSEEVSVDDSFIQRTLSPYARKGCIYQRTAVHCFHSDAVSHASYSTFSIPDSCYIDSTGHFNAVEMNICVNQMFYVLWADVVRRRKVAEAAHWTEEDFKIRQLPGMLIVRIQSEFRRPIDPTGFRAEGRFERVRAVGSGKKRMIFLRARASFTDDNSGLARGEVDFALLDG
jgi:hypothetical protein